jgi:polyribonucleotide 5'-hydroxyl-kinase
MTASVMTSESVSVTSYAGAGNTLASGTNPIVLWYGSTDVSAQPDLYQAHISQLGNLIDMRTNDDMDVRSSGIIINTCGWIEDVGYKFLLHTISAFRVNVLLIMGHDRLYSMLQSHFKHKMTEESISSAPLLPKVIKLPRSGGVVSRDAPFRRISRSLCIKRYFHGDLVPSVSTTNTSPILTHQYRPVLLELPFSNLRLFKLSTVSLSASMLPIAAKQTTDPIQLNEITALSPSLTHALLAVCHPNAVQAFDKSGDASDLYSSGVAGFIAVERVNMDKDILSVLSPCSGSLPSQVMIMGDVTWME